MRTQFSYGSQLTFVIIMTGVSFAITSPQIVGIVTTCLCALWYEGFFLWLIPKFPDRPATRAETAGGFGQLWSDLVEIRTKYPEAFKYLVFLFLAQNGMGSTVLTLAPTFLLEHLEFTSLQISLLYLVTLIFGQPALMIFKAVQPKLSWRTLHLINIFQ